MCYRAFVWVCAFGCMRASSYARMCGWVGVRVCANICGWLCGGVRVGVGVMSVS